MSWNLKSIFFNHGVEGKKTRVVLTHAETREEKGVDLRGESHEHRDLCAEALQRLAVEQIDLA